MDWVWGGTNLYYEINAYNSISSNISFIGRNTPSKNTTDYNYVSWNSELDTSYQSVTDSEKDIKKIEWTTDYTKTFDEEGRELSISVQIGGRLKDEDTYLSENNGLIELQNINDEKNIEQTFQLDYTYPLNDHKIEIGSKVINRDQEMQYYTTRSDDMFAKLPTEVFNYNQIVHASYLSTQFQLPNDFGLKGGLQHEITNIKG